MIYKSLDYLHLIASELRKCVGSVGGWDVGVRIVANDANNAVIDALKKSDTPYSIYNDRKPNDYYLNRVYRCWNYCVESSNYDNVCLVNSDMVFSKGWLKNLLKHHDGVNIPCSRLVESGKMPSGKHGLSYNCGRTARTVDHAVWERMVNKTKSDCVKEGGLYMPCVIERDRFIESGMYPEGNIYKDGAGTCNGPVIQSGDNWYFNKLKSEYGMRHITAFDSLVYHIQEGEKDG
jgi:hypothetical protein